MSIHLLGGGWSADGDPELTRGFVDEASARAAGAGRIVPRIGVLLVGEDESQATAYPASFERVASCRPVGHLSRGEPFGSEVLSDIDGLVIGGGLTPAYLAAVDGITEEIRLLVADGLPYLGLSAGAMIAADRAIVGGYRINGIAVCPPETGEDLEEVTIEEGLGLIDLAVDVHAAQWGTLGRLVAATEAGLLDGGVAIDEFTSLVVGERGYRVRGAGSVWRVTDEPAGVVVGTIGA